MHVSYPTVPPDNNRSDTNSTTQGNISTDLTVRISIIQLQHDVHIIPHAYSNVRVLMNILRDEMRKALA
jgi:hypothetical protein